MTNEPELNQPKVTVNLHTSSTTGKEAYSLTVLAGATQDEADAVLAIALDLRAKAKAALSQPAEDTHVPHPLGSIGEPFVEPPSGYVEKLDASIRRLGGKV